MGKSVLLFIGLILMVPNLWAVDPVSSSNKISRMKFDIPACSPLSETSGKFVYDFGCLNENVEKLPVTYTNFPAWQQMVQKPIHQRLITSEKDLINFLKLKSFILDFKDTYDTIEIVEDPVILQAAIKAISSLPKELEKYIGNNFYGFMLVKNAGWSAFSVPIKVAPGGGPNGAVIILNADNLKDKTLNEWLAFKEKSAFNINDDSNSYPKYTLQMKFSRKNQPSTFDENVRHILLHEVSHLIAFSDTSIHPEPKYKNTSMPVSEILKFVKTGEPIDSAFPFLSYDWSYGFVQGDANKPAAFSFFRKLPQDLVPILRNKKVKFYASNPADRFSPEEAIKMYNGLNKTCFPSIYATVDYLEDFAESVTHYFMIVKEQYEFQVNLTMQESHSSKPRTVASFRDNSWSRKDCSGKRKFIEKLFLK